CRAFLAYRALYKRAQLRARNAGLIVGAGGVGLNAVMLSRAVLKCRVVVADIDANKREAALKAGATAAFDNSDPEAVQKLTAITAADAGAGGAIDFVGAPQSAKFGLDALR